MTTERGNTIQGVELEVFCVGVGRTGLDEFDVEVVGFRDCEKDSRASIVLEAIVQSVGCDFAETASAVCRRFFHGEALTGKP